MTRYEPLICWLARWNRRRKRAVEAERMWVSQGQPSDFPVIIREGLIVLEGDERLVTDWCFDSSKMEGRTIDASDLIDGLVKQYPHRVVDLR